MFKVDKMLLMSGQDIPLLGSNIIIHHPTLKEIINTFLTEDNFFTGYELLFFSKEEQLGLKEQQALESISNFEVLLSLLKYKDKSPMEKQLSELEKMFYLLFNYYDNINFEEEQIVLSKQDKYVFFIKEKEFENIKNIVRQLFPFKNGENKLDYNPQGVRAQQIAQKLKKAKKKIAQEKKDKNISLFERYISILSIGLKIPVFEFQNYTM